MTCKDCIHENVCSALIKDGLPWEDGKYPAEALCMAFRNKADVVEVVRCRDCKHFQPSFVLTAEGERRPYTEEEIKNGKMVRGDVGINCGSRCERFGYWEDNRFPVWFQENDFCSYGERKDHEN